MNSIPNVTLNNGVEMPIIGYGVYQVEPQEAERCVLDAISVGYRSIDTAQAYYNEEGVGLAISKCGIPRDQLFITTKVWINNAGKERAAKSIEESLRKLKTDYVDLLLIHQPFNDYYGSYHAMQDALHAGKARAIGVSNFYPDRFIDIARFADVVPAVNQIETHVFQQQKIARKHLARYGTQIESWGPLAEGRNGLFTNPVLTNIGAAHGRTAAQIALRFLMQSGVVIIPKSTRRERMEENLAILDFSLTPEEMSRIEALDGGKSLWFNHEDPETVEWFMEYCKEHK